MPHVQYRALVDVTADAPAVVRAAAILDVGAAAPITPVVTDPGTTAYAAERTDGTAGTLRIVYEIESPPTADPPATATRVRVTVRSDVKVPYFRWFVVPLTWFMVRREARYRTVALGVVLAGGDAPERTSSALLPPAHFTVEQAAYLSVAAFAAAAANFGGALVGQEGTYVRHGYHVSTAALGDMLTLSRFGVLVALVAAVLADRVGRRRLILWGLVGVALSNLVSAVAPTFLVFSMGQFLTRGFVNAVLPVAAIAIIEEAPEGARAFALAMLALAMGAGYAVSVFLLPFSDLGPHAFRIPFAVSALTILCVPRLGRRLSETRRYEVLRREGVERGRFREVFDRRHARLLLLVALSGFLGNIFSAPASQLTNAFLSDDRHFSATGIAIWRAVTAGLPALIGVIIGGRLADIRGRKPVAITALVIVGGLEIAFFLGPEWLLWTSSTVAIFAAGIAGPAVGTFSTELFPTEVRGTSNGIVTVAGVFGAVIGITGVTRLSDHVGGLGPALAISAIVPILVALFIIPRFPEGAHQNLDDISPTIAPHDPEVVT